MPRPVYVIGAARTDFRRNLRKQGKSLLDVIEEVGRDALADAAIEPSAVQAGVVGNFAAGMYTGQLHLGSLLVGIDPMMRGIPTFHAEAACASGGVAVLTAAQWVAFGLFDRVLVVGAEQQKTMSPAEGAEVLAAAADRSAEKPVFGSHLMPRMFATIADRYAAVHGLDLRHLATVVAKNHAQAALNPMAQTRESGMTMEMALHEGERNPSIAPPLKVSDCSQITDGAAAVVVASEPIGPRRPLVLRGYGHATDSLRLADKDVPTFRVAHAAVRQAYAMAGVVPGDLDAVELHDCFSITELVTYELLGLAEPGGGGALLESGATTVPSVRERIGVALRPARSTPVNCGGGLIGDGHPVGATGVRQVVELFQHANGLAGERQVERLRTGLTFNLGGTFTTSVAMVWSSG